MIYNGDMTEILKAIRKAMVDNDIQQKDIAEKLNQSKGTISNFLKGKSKNATLDSLKQYADAAGCDLVIEIVNRNKIDNN